MSADAQCRQRRAFDAAFAEAPAGGHLVVAYQLIDGVHLVGVGHDHLPAHSTTVTDIRSSWVLYHTEHSMLRQARLSLMANTDR